MIKIKSCGFLMTRDKNEKKILLSRGGFEPPTVCVLDRRDNQLHQRDYSLQMFSFKFPLNDSKQVYGFIIIFHF